MLSRNTGIKQSGGNSSNGFTIVELILVIAIIGILASISIVSYGNWQKKLVGVQLKSDLGGVATAMENSRNFNSGYPSSIPVTFTPSQYVTLSGGGSSDSKEYCIDAASTKDATIHYYIDQDNIKSAQVGTCATRPVKWTSISTYSYDTCAITSGKAYCWGYNGINGRLGNNSNIDSKVPVAVDTSGALNGKTVTAIAVGEFHTCAIASGQAYCWGPNGYGQLGNASIIKSIVPVKVDTSGVLNGKTVTAIAVGEYFSCAIAGGQAYCWGYNGFGSLGNNSSTDADSNVPVAVNTAGVLNGKTITAIGTGYAHTCVVANGQAYCWGYNSFGNLGDNSTILIQKKLPVAVYTAGVLNGKTVTAISAGLYHTCAIANGQAYCWGNNGNGQLGDNSITQRNVPVEVDITGVFAGKTITSISAGTWHSCAITSGQAYCWGDNSYGRLGNNSTTQSNVPFAVYTAGVLNSKTITAIAAGNSTCGLANSRAYCWGYNYSGQLGNNSLIDSLIPFLVSEP